MGERGHTLHLLRANARDALAALGTSIAILGESERWTSFVPLVTADLDLQDASETLEAPIVDVWFDDDAGVVAHVYAAGEDVGELALPGADGDISEADFDLLEKLDALDVIRRTERAALLKRMSTGDELHAWTMAHGLEKLLALPYFAPLPPDVPEAELRSLLPEGAEVLSSKRAKKPRAKPKAAARPVEARVLAKWTAAEETTVALHVEYWATVFSMNNWKLYNRYKKHLPGDQRSDVDALCSAVANGDDEAINAGVRSILARIWIAEDWDAVIRSPDLVDGDDDVWEAWRARLGD